jgi:LmbE family N-acetylglucosaminyl deacetylase
MESSLPPPIEAPARVLAIGTHPDDLEHFAGATLAGLAERGAQISLVVCTDGARGGHESGDLVARRRREAEQSAAVLGVGAPLFLGLGDGDVVVDERIRKPLVHEIRRVRPELLLTHDPTTLWKRIGAVDRLGHSDHRAVGTATLDAISPRAALGAFYPEHAAAGLKPWFVREIWLFDTAAPDHFVDVRPTVAKKRAAIACHASQNPTMLHAEAERHEGSYVGHTGFPAEGFRRLRIF